VGDHDDGHHQLPQEPHEAARSAYTSVEQLMTITPEFRIVALAVCTGTRMWRGPEARMRIASVPGGRVASICVVARPNPHQSCSSPGSRMISVHQNWNLIVAVRKGGIMSERRSAYVPLGFARPARNDYRVGVAREPGPCSSPATQWPPLMGPLCLVPCVARLVRDHNRAVPGLDLFPWLLGRFEHVRAELRMLLNLIHELSPPTRVGVVRHALNEARRAVHDGRA